MGRMNFLLGEAGLPAARAAGTETTTASAQAPESIQALLRGISGMQRLPVAGVQMVQAGERVLFVSACRVPRYLGRVFHSDWDWQPMGNSKDLKRG